MITIRPLNKPEELGAFIQTQPLQPFLQSWAWGEFQSKVGRRIWRLGAWEGEALVGAALVADNTPSAIFGPTPASI